MIPDQTDPLARGHHGATWRPTVVGIFEIMDPDDPYWAGDTTLERTDSAWALDPDTVFTSTRSRSSLLSRTRA